MTDILERLRKRPAGDIAQSFERNEAADEIEMLRNNLAIQYGMHPGGDLAKAAQAEIDRLREELADVRADAALLRDEVERLRAALQSLTTDPPATLDEPDTDAEIVIKMRAIARRALEPKP